jgi:hypothetical protein
MHHGQPAVVALRTDLTAVCTPCRLRFSRRHERCPRCGGEPLDLRLGAARERVTSLCVPAWQPPASPGERWRRGRQHIEWLADWAWPLVLSGSARWFPRGLILAAMLGGFLRGGDGLVMASLAAAVVMILAAFVLLVGGKVVLDGLLAIAVGASWLFAGVERTWRLSRYRQALSRRRRLTLFEEPAVRGARVRGRVRTVDEPVVSPRGFRCAAFRVVGQAAWGDVDDAVAARLVVDTEWGPVELDPATTVFELPAGAPSASTQTLPHFPPGPVPARLAESLLLDGDEVELEGAVEERMVPDGYRGQTISRRLVGPLRVTPCRP